MASVLLPLLGSVAAMNETGAVCSPSNLGPGAYPRTLQSGGLSRTYNLHIPTNYDNSKKVKLIVVLHGLTETAEQIEAQTRLSTMADGLPADQTYVAVYPQGVSNSWNAGVCCGAAQKQGVKDSQFILDVINDVSSVSCIGAEQVYVTGFSNGCHMSEVLACEYPTIFRAMACQSGCMSLRGGNPACNQVYDPQAHPISVFEVHGTADPLVAYNGVSWCPGVQATFDAWGTRNGCTGPKNTTYSAGAFTCQRYTGCENKNKIVQQCVKQGGVHAWYYETDFSTTTAVLQFFGVLPY